MQIPISTALKALDATQFQICYFRDLNHKPGSPPHNYVSVPIGNRLILCLCMITTKYEDLYKKYKKTGFLSDEKNLIYLDNHVFSFLNANKGCVINCNNVEIFTEKDLQKRIDPTKYFEIRAKESDFPVDLKEKICKAIINSRQVRKHIKEYIRNSFYLSDYIK